MMEWDRKVWIVHLLKDILHKPFVVFTPEYLGRFGRFFGGHHHIADKSSMSPKGEKYTTRWAATAT